MCIYIYIYGSQNPAPKFSFIILSSACSIISLHSCLDLLNRLFYGFPAPNLSFWVKPQRFQHNVYAGEK